MTAGAAETDEDDSFASVGISTCLLLLCAGTLLAYLLHLAAQRAPRRLRPWLRPPTESWLWALLGLGAGLVLESGLSARLATVVEQIDASFPTLFFSALLPPIIFDSGYNLNHRFFFSNIGSICIFAFLGTVVAFAVLALGLYYGLGGANGLLTPLEACAFGALISAVDPVATLCIFSSTGADPKLNALIFGESVLNDAVAIVRARSRLEL